MGAQQGTPQWFKERAGHATASRFSDVLAKIKTGEAASRRNYRTQLVTERLTGQAVEGFHNAAMQWGTDHEAQARSLVEALHGHTVITTGFIHHESIKWSGCSPDGLIGEEGMIQIKCPYVSTIHVEAMLADKMPIGHYAQIQGEMWVTGRKWSLFTSYDPRMPDHLKLYSKMVPRDNAYIEELQREVSLFLSEVEALHKKLLTE